MADNCQQSADVNMSPKEPQNDKNGGQKRDVIDSPEESEEVLAEIESVNDNLDSLNSALDFIEQRTDSIRSQLLMLLESSREIRQELKNEDTPMDEEATSNSDEKNKQ